MAIYVDDADIEFRGTPRCHMTGDSKAELHEFAQSIGVKRCWYHKGDTHPHYDVTHEQKAAAIRCGALEVSQRELLVACKHLIRK